MSKSQYDLKNYGCSDTLIVIYFRNLFNKIMERIIDTAKKIYACFTEVKKWLQAVGSIISVRFLS